MVFQFDGTVSSGVATLEPRIESALSDLEGLYGRLAIARLASFLTCTEFGLSETELLELLMPTTNSAASLTLSSGNYNFSTLCAVRRRMGELHASGLSFFSFLFFSFSLSVYFFLFQSLPFCRLSALFSYLFVHLFIYSVFKFVCVFSFSYVPSSLLSSF
jgi:hypothetical protein